MNRPKMTQSSFRETNILLSIFCSSLSQKSSVLLDFPFSMWRLGCEFKFVIYLPYERNNEKL